MTIEKIHSYLVHPGNSDDRAKVIKGANITSANGGRLWDMLLGVYENSDEECKIEIIFSPTDDGKQKNPMLDLVHEYAKAPTMIKGRSIAGRLQKATTGKSGLGLLFLIVGKQSGVRKVVISRFPADTGVVAEEHGQDLSVSYIEKVFMKSAKSYKAVAYSGKNKSEFWKGTAVDKQINNKASALSDYWIGGFLLSDLRSTGPAGTRRLAIALKAATISADSLEVKEELTAACKLASNHNGVVLSASSFCKKMGFSSDAKTELKKAMGGDHLFTQRFRFTVSEFRKYVTLKSVELSNGAILMANADNFEDVFLKEQLSNERVRYSTEGKIEAQKLSKK